MLSTTEGKRPRTFRVQKDTGDYWNMAFNRSGITWTPADDPFDEPAGSSSPQLPPFGRIGPVEAITSIVDTAVNIGMLWEVRQQRLLNEAMNDEARRTAWLADMIARWSDVHRSGNQLDFRVSEYLAREATETMNSIVANKRIALPQSMLYELETIQDTFRSFRSLMLTQFEAIANDSSIDLDGAVRKALPHSSLNMDFIRALGEDPSAEWTRRVQEKTTGDFERELTGAVRDPSLFLSRVFPSTELAIPKLQDAEKNPGLAERLITLLAPALPRLLAVEPKTDASERRDAYRELSLLSAEVSRVKALNSAWLATSAIVAVSSGKELQVRVSALGLGVSLATPQTRRELLPANPRAE